MNDSILTLRDIFLLSEIFEIIDFGKFKGAFESSRVQLLVSSECDKNIIGREIYYSILNLFMGKIHLCKDILIDFIKSKTKNSENVGFDDFLCIFVNEIKELLPFYGEENIINEDVIGKSVSILNDFNPNFEVNNGYL